MKRRHSDHIFFLTIHMFDCEVDVAHIYEYLDLNQVIISNLLREGGGYHDWKLPCHSIKLLKR